MHIEPDHMPHGCRRQQPQMMDELQVDTRPDKCRQLDQYQDKPQGKQGIPELLLGQVLRRHRDNQRSTNQ